MAKRVALTPEQQRQKALASLYGKEGTNAGNAFIGQYLQPGVLGRVDTNIEGKDDIMNRYKAGLGGYTAPEYQAQREQMSRGLNSNLQTNLGQLAKAQARGKVYGAAASAQQANALTGAQQSKDNLEQDLMVKNIDEQQKRLGEYSAQQGNFNQQGLERQKINLGQANAETAAQTSAFQTIAGLGLTKAQNKQTNSIYERALRAMR